MSVVTPAILAAELRAKGAEMTRQAGTVVIATAARIQRDAKLMAPVDTGNLRASITRESTRTADGAVSVVGPEASYGHYVEGGTTRQAPQPYLLPAAMRHEDAFYDALAELAGFDSTPSFGTASVMPGGGQ